MAQNPVYAGFPQVPGYPQVIKSGAVGGYRGQEFDMLRDLGQVEGWALFSVTVWSGSSIDAIQCVWDNGTIRKPGAKVGGGGGRPVTYTIPEGEWIYTVNGMSGARLDQMQCFTNTGKSSPRFGEPGGVVYSCTPPQWDMALIGFQGMCDDRINLLAPLWIAPQPKSYEMKIKKWGDIPNSLKTTPNFAFMSSGEITNDGSRSLKSSVELTVEEQESMTLSLSETYRDLIMNGLEVGVSVEASGGVEGVASAKISASLTQTTNRENETTKSTTTDNSVTKSASITNTYSFTTPPWTKTVAKLVGTRTEVRDLTWEGELTPIYVNGRKGLPKSVKGTVKGAFCTDQKVVFVETPLENRPKKS